MSDAIAHLWSSTLFLGVAMIAARFLPLTARTRYALLLAGLVKFAVPAAAIVVPLRALGIDFARPAAVVAMQWLGGPVTFPAAPAAPSVDWRLITVVVWIGSAALLALVWAITHRRLVSSAFGTMSPASPRERQALTAARHRLGIRASIDIRRSTICEAPAVIRIVRPVVVLPDGGCDALDDDELESLLRHECAHVARRDNLVGLVESAIVAAFWFHPLVWLAQRAIATAREEACDETAATSADSLDTYVSALEKICRALIAPRVAGVSCMASAHLKERLTHLMHYESLRQRALSHRFVTGFAAVAVLFVALASGLNAAPASSSKEDRYRLEWTIGPGDRSPYLQFTGRIIDNATSEVVSEPKVLFPRGVRAAVSLDHDRGGKFDVVITSPGETVDVELKVTEHGAVIQRSTYSGAPEYASRRYTGQPISMNLEKADIKDVLNQFAKITGAKIEYSPTLKGSVTVNVKDMPWDEAFDLILRQNNLTFEHKDGAIVVK